MSNTVYIISKIDNNSYCKTNGQFTKHLRKNNLTYQQYYETYISGYTPLCNCGKSLTFYQKTETYANSCGNSICVGKLGSKTKQNWTAEQRDNDSCNKKKSAALRSIEQKQTQYKNSKETFRKKYGVDWVTQSTVWKDKSRQTKQEKYGNATFNGSDKTKAAWQSKNNNEIAEIVNKRRATCLERFGVENALMKPESKKNSAKSNSQGKDYKLPSGRVIGIRGNEDIVISKLLESYNEQDLLFDDRKTIYMLPVFNYVDHRRHRMKYHPDVYIFKENKIIEVKSRWWWDGNGSPKYKSRLENNLQKKTAVLSAGYNYEVWLFESKVTYKVLQWNK